MPYSSITFLDDREVILNYIESRSLDMFDYIQSHPDTKFTLWYKNLTHSDLTNRGKRNGWQEGLDKNLLYYLSVREMREIEEASEKPFESAKQSNIGMSDAFYRDLEMPRLQRRQGPQTTQHEHLRLNDYADVYLVNETVKYFTMEYTNKVIRKTGKSIKWDNSETVTLSGSKFTPIQITQAIHGLGTADDTEFHKLRLSMFCNDTFIVLIEHSAKKNVYVMLEKNPRFFTLVGEANQSWEQYLQVKRQQEQARITAQTVLVVEEEKSRTQQSAWKELLAKEMMNYTTHEGEVFCPFTQISADFESVPMLFIASHIKRFADSDAVEAYDVNNGLLLCANADALFDKYMITVDENKQLVFSFLIENNQQLRHKLLLNQPIFGLILNEKRMEYMKEHRRIFYIKEEERKNTKK
ncbi:MAG: HNH endonuclease [Clostridia bacterium]|nr:HNH endonuclease [Clostridia bacterium]